MGEQEHDAHRTIYQKTQIDGTEAHHSIGD